MRTAALFLTAMLVLAATAPAARAQAPADKADARCIVVLELAASDAKQRAAAAQGQFYFFGRLMARGFSGKMDPLLLEEAKSVARSPQQIQPELNRCSAELNYRGAEFRAAIANLRQAGRPPAKRPAT